MDDKNRLEDLNSREITRLGNPGKPEGEAGKMMLQRMNQDHSNVTTWALSKIEIENEENPLILDIGCGGGNTLKLLSGKYPAALLHGIDYSEVSVRMSTAYNQEEVEKGRMQITEGSVENMPYDDDTFSVITTVESFYFWPDSLNNLKEVRRVLKPGGRFYLIADIYGKEDLDEDVLSNIAEYNLTNPTVEEFIWLFAMAGFKKTKIHLKEHTDWICVEGRK